MIPHYSFNHLYNLFFDRCKEFSGDKDQTFCCVALSVEHFHLFNEIYGRRTGDKLLSSIFDLLIEMEKNQQCVFEHFGYDHFILFMEYNLKEIDYLYMNVQKILENYGTKEVFAPTMGINRIESVDQISQEMIDHANTALEGSKKNLSVSINEFDYSSYKNELKEAELLQDLRTAVDKGEITFYLQPQCRTTNRKIVGAEALARWVKADGTMISPAKFIPVLEKNGFIADFDRYIWGKIFAWISSLLKQGIKPVPISLNISQIDIMQMDVCDVLCKLAEKYQVPASYVKAEITESAYAKQSSLVDKLVHRLKDNGFVTMMDDFGSGYSSLNMLENVSVDVLKLDMVFVKETNIRSKRGITIIESIVNMAKMMNLPIVVEGVETEEQVQFIKNLGCRYAQGYYFYKAIPTDEFTELMKNPDQIDNRGFRNKRNEQLHLREFLDEASFTDAMLNNILGAVAFYSLDGKDLTINRFNEQFYEAIGDAEMEGRQIAIQNYVVAEDHPALYKALEDATSNGANGGTCEIRFYKSDNSVFWFHLHFYYIGNEQQKQIFYGKVEDVTEIHEQSLRLLEVLRQQSEVSLVINLNLNSVQYVTGSNTLYQTGLPAIDLKESIERTIAVRIEDEKDKEAFREFFDSERLKSAYRKAIYHEKITVGFRLTDFSEPVEFSTHYIRNSKEQDFIVYAFAKKVS